MRYLSLLVLSTLVLPASVFAETMTPSLGDFLARNTIKPTSAETILSLPWAPEMSGTTTPTEWLFVVDDAIGSTIDAMLTPIGTKTPTPASKSPSLLSKSGSTGVKKGLPINPKKELTQEQLDCAITAMRSREQDLDYAYSTFSAAMLYALDVRTDALLQSWMIRDPSARRVVRNSAWTSWKKDIKTARAELNTTKRTAWSTYKEAINECQVHSSEIEDMATQTSDGF